MEIISEEVIETIGVCPGDDITESLLYNKQDVTIGKGISIIQTNNSYSIQSMVAGTLCSKKPSHFWVDSNVRIYEPQVGDTVIGIIEDRGGDFYRVNIFSFSSAILNRLSFEGATKRNKPEYKKGDVIYAIVKTCNKHIDTELTCIPPSGSRKDWSSGDTIFGDLSEGLIIHVSQAYAFILLSPENIIFHLIGKYISFEVAVGINGIIWFKTKICKEMIVIRNLILSCETIDSKEASTIIEKTLKHFKREIK